MSSPATLVRHGTIIAVALAGLASIVGLATSLGISARSLGAATVAAPRCTNAGLLVVPNLSGANVVSVTVNSLPSSCGGATIQATVNNGSAAGSGTSSVPPGGGSITVTLAAAVAATTAEQLDVVLTGP